MNEFDFMVTQVQETGWFRPHPLNVGVVLGVLETAGIDPNDAEIRAGTVYVLDREGFPVAR